MGRPKLKNNNKKVKLGITISVESQEMLLTIDNKSEFIDGLIKKFFKYENMQKMWYRKKYNRIQ